MRYMGSKSRIAKYIVPILQNEINKNNIKTYIEPFVGGANVIDKIVCEHKIGYDINPYLIALHERVQKDKPLYKEVSKELYDDVRDCYNNGDERYTLAQIGCVGFLASYNGRWFDGGYATPGYEGDRYRDYYREAKDNLLKQSQQKLYKDIYFGVSSFDSSSISCFVNSLIYCDPPYEGTKQYGINKEFDHKRFWEWVRKMSWKNYVFVSEEHAPDDFECIWEQEVSRSIKATDKSKSVERLFVYRG